MILRMLDCETVGNRRFWNQLEHPNQELRVCLAFNSKLTHTITSEVVRTCVRKQIALCPINDTRLLLIPPDGASESDQIRNTHDKIRRFEVQKLIRSLRSCPQGRQGWRKYEDICEEIFRLLFVPPLDEPFVQPVTIDQIKRRDLIFANRATGGFWRTEVHTRYKGEYVLVECKNLKQNVSAKELQQALDYLIPATGIGLFGIVLTRTPLDSQARRLQNAEWTRSPHKMLVALQDRQLRQMLDAYLTGGSSARIIQDGIDAIRTGVV